jgi:hypothetical protein
MQKCSYKATQKTIIAAAILRQATLDYVSQATSKPSVPTLNSIFGSTAKSDCGVAGYDHGISQYDFLQKTSTQLLQFVK